MLAASAVRIDPDDPLPGSRWASAPRPEAPDGWVTVRLRAASLNHHDLWSLRGVGLPDERAPDGARLRRRRRRRGRQRGDRALGHRRSGLPRRRDARPEAVAALGAVRRHARRRGRRAAAQPRAQAGRAVLGGGGLPADRLADGLPDAVHQVGRAARRHGAGAGRRWRGVDGADRDRPRGRAIGCGSPAATRPSGRGRSSSGADAGVRDRGPAAGAGRRGDGDGRARRPGTTASSACAQGGTIVVSGATGGHQADDRPAPRSSSCSCASSARRWAPATSCCGLRGSASPPASGR